MSIKEEQREVTSWWKYIVIGTMLTILAFGAFNLITRPFQVVNEVASTENIITSYEQFQEMYNTTQAICTKIQTLEQLPDDYSSGGFTKIERIINETNNLTRWVEEYNAKSKMITKNLWKSPKLPYQLEMETICLIN